MKNPRILVPTAWQMIDHWSPYYSWASEFSQLFAEVRILPRWSYMNLCSLLESNPYYTGGNEWYWHGLGQRCRNLATIIIPARGFDTNDHRMILLDSYTSYSMSRIWMIAIEEAIYPYIENTSVHMLWPSIGSCNHENSRNLITYCQQTPVWHQ